MTNKIDLLCECCGRPEPGRGGFTVSRAQLRNKSKTYHDVTLKMCSACVQKNLKRSGETNQKEGKENEK